MAPLKSSIFVSENAEQKRKLETKFNGFGIRFRDRENQHTEAKCRNRQTQIYKNKFEMFCKYNKNLRKKYCKTKKGTQSKIKHKSEN